MRCCCSLLELKLSADITKVATSRHFDSSMETYMHIHKKTLHLTRAADGHFEAWAKKKKKTRTQQPYWNSIKWLGLKNVGNTGMKICFSTNSCLKTSNREQPTREAFKWCFWPVLLQQQQTSSWTQSWQVKGSRSVRTLEHFTLFPWRSSRFQIPWVIPSIKIQGNSSWTNTLASFHKQQQQ